jgi:hypothetical protein
MERLRAVVPSLAGPVLIVVSVLAVLWRFAFGGLISIQHPDLLPYWWPTGCFLGRSLASGHIPAWNPHVMGGVPFAADPQSGWMSFVPMALFSALPCAAAIRWFLIAQPILAGLGLYAFMRSEEISRAGSTTAGLVISLMVSGSLLLLNPALSATIAWTAITLAAASRLLRATRWEARVLWVLATALAWGQLAAAHLSQGLVIGSVAIVSFIAAATTRNVRAGRARGTDAVAIVALLVAALPLVNLAYLLPRLVYLPRTTLHLGYARLDQLARSLGSNPIESGPSETGTLTPTFPLRMGAAPGLYAGAVALLLAFAGWWSKRHRALVVAFSAFGALSYVVSLGAVVHAVQGPVGRTFLGQFYLHAPGRFVFGLVIALPVLAGLGVESWRHARIGSARSLMLLPGLVVWAILPPILGLHRTDLLIPLVGIAAGLFVLALSAARPAAAVLIPLVLAVELMVNGLAGQSGAPGPGGSHDLAGFAPLERPTIHAADYTTLGPIARALQRSFGGRYLSLAPNLWTPLGYHVLRRPDQWGLMATQRSMIFGLEEGQGYNPIQSLRYWSFVRAADPKAIRYNAAGFTRASPLVLDLLQVAYLIEPRGDPSAVPGSVPVATEGAWRLDALPAPPPPLSVVASWTVAPSADAALREILVPGFDPASQVVVEGDPGLGVPAGGSGGSARFEPDGPQAARIDVDAFRPSLVLVRIVYDPGWRAEVDGRPVRVLPADSLLQAVAVPAGRHTIRLTYRDPSIGFGLLGSSLVVVAMLGLALGVGRRERAAAQAAAPDA